MNKLKGILDKPTGEFSRNIFTIIGGTGMAQAIPLLISPILARYFGPSEFGYLALLMAVFNPISVILGGRLEMALVLPKEDSLALKLANMAFFSGLAISLILIPLSFWLSPIIAIWFEEPEISWILPIVPFMLIPVSLFQPLNFWLQRKKAFRRIVWNKFGQSISLSLVSIILGLIGISSGLISGYFAGWLVIAVTALFHSVRVDFKLKIPKKEDLMEVWKSYGDFPKYNTLPALMNTAALSIPVFFITDFFSTEQTGLYNLCRQLLFLPSSFISSAISQVFYERITSLINQEEKVLRSISRLMLFLIAPALVVIGIIVLWAPQLFGFFLGETWIPAGEIAMIIVFPTMLQLIVVPVAVSLPALGRIRFQSGWQAFYFLLVCSIYLFPTLSFTEFIWLISAIEILAYLIYMLFILYFASRHDKQLNDGQVTL